MISSYAIQLYALHIPSVLKKWIPRNSDAQEEYMENLLMVRENIEDEIISESWFEEYENLWIIQNPDRDISYPYHEVNVSREITLNVL